MSKASAAVIGYFIAANGTLVTGNFDYLNYIRVVFIAAHSELYTLTEDGSFFIYTAAHRRLVTGDELFRNIYNILKKLILPRQACHLA